MQKQQRRVVENPAQTGLPCLSFLKILLKSLPNAPINVLDPAIIQSKSCPNPPQTLFKPSCHCYLASKLAWGQLWAAFWVNLVPTWRSNRLQNRCQNLKKSIPKTNTISASIFSWFGRRFRRNFRSFFASKIHANY